MVQETGKKSDVRASLSPFAVGLFAIMAIVVGIAIMAYGGYRAGIKQRVAVAATEVANEVQMQYSLAIQDMEIGQSGVALQRLEYILKLNPDYLDAADLLAKAREDASGLALRSVQPTEVLQFDEDRLSAEERFRLLMLAYDSRDWSETVQRASDLKVTNVDHRSETVNGMLFVSLRNRGIERIDSGLLELGLTDLEHSEQIMSLDNVALQRRRWASLYLAGMAFWDLNWQLVIENFSVLNAIAPNFQDARILLREAYISYGDELVQSQESCLAKEQFVAAREIAVDSKIDDQLSVAEKKCFDSTDGESTKTSEDIS